MARTATGLSVIDAARKQLFEAKRLMNCGVRKRLYFL